MFGLRERWRAYVAKRRQREEERLARGTIREIRPVLPRGSDPPPCPRCGSELRRIGRYLRLDLRRCCFHQWQEGHWHNLYADRIGDQESCVQAEDQEDPREFGWCPQCHQALKLYGDKFDSYPTSEAWMEALL